MTRGICLTYMPKPEGKGIYIRQILIAHVIPYSKKLWRSKSLVKRATARHWQKKLWRMLTCIANHQSLINSKTKLNDAIPNINEHNKMNSIFSRICLVPHASSMLFDDGEVHC